MRNKNIDFSDLQNGGQLRVTIEMKGIVSVSTKRVLLATIPEIILAGIHYFSSVYCISEDEQITISYR